MTALALLALETLDPGRRSTPSIARPLGIIALDRSPEAAAEAATRTLDRLLDRWSAFMEAFAPWLAAHPAPQGGSAHGRLALDAWEEAYRDARRRAWSDVLGRPPTALEGILLPVLHRPAAGRLPPRITCTPLPLVPVEDPA